MTLERNFEDLQQNLIIEWLLNTNDEFLKNSIDKCPDKDFTGCNNYIMQRAKEMLHGKSGYLKDDIVFGFAKEYFIDYEARKLHQEKLDKENKEKALKQRANDTLVNVKSMFETLKNNYQNLFEKYKLNLISYSKELETGLVKTNDKIDEINRFLAVITDQLDLLRKKEQKFAENEKEKEDEKSKNKDYGQKSVFDFLEV